LPSRFAVQSVVNRTVFLTFALGASLGLALAHSPVALPLTRLVGVGCVLASLLAVLLCLLVTLKRLPRSVRLTLGLVALGLVGRSVYLALRYHGLTSGLVLGGFLVVLWALWSTPLFWPRLALRQAALLALVCGMGVALQLTALPPLDLLRSSRNSPTPLGRVSHFGLLGGVALLSLGACLRPCTKSTAL
jgi:hypothetical protein